MSNNFLQYMQLTIERGGIRTHDFHLRRGNPVFHLKLRLPLTIHIIATYETPVKRKSTLFPAFPHVLHLFCNYLPI